MFGWFGKAIYWLCLPNCQQGCCCGQGPETKCSIFELKSSNKPLLLLVFYPSIPLEPFVAPFSHCGQSALIASSMHLSSSRRVTGMHSSFPNPCFNTANLASSLRLFMLKLSFWNNVTLQIMISIQLSSTQELVLLRRQQQAGSHVLRGPTMHIGPACGHALRRAESLSNSVI